MSHTPTLRLHISTAPNRLLVFMHSLFTKTEKAQTKH